MELKFTAPKKELLKTLKIIKNGLPRGKHGALINLELKIGLNIISLALPGLSHEVYGKTSGIGKNHRLLVSAEIAPANGRKSQGGADKPNHVERKETKLRHDPACGKK